VCVCVCVCVTHKDKLVYSIYRIGHQSAAISDIKSLRAGDNRERHQLLPPP